MHDNLVDHVVPLALGGLLVTALSWRRGRGWHSGALPRGVRWARTRDLRRLLLPAGPLPTGRLVLGEVSGGTRRRLVVATEDAQSVVVVGPTQSGKTSSLALPALLEWDGPVVAASVKSDLLRHSMTARSQRGQVWCIDPTSSTGVRASQWSPLTDCTEWMQACRMASDLTDAAKVDAISADGEFWYATAAKLLAPLFFAAARDGRGMADVVRWVDTQEVGEVAEALERVGHTAALDAARATWCRDERTRSSVYTTAETVLAPFAYSTDSWDRFEPSQLLGGCHSLYVCAPAHDQRRLRGYFTALVQQVLGHAFAVATRQGGPLDPPLLVVLDEAAHIAPLAELDGLAATCASHGIQLVTIWQDVAQVRARYGARAPTVLNNHRAKLFLPGIADPDTLEYASTLIGETDVPQASVTRDGRGTHTTTSTSAPRRLLSPAELRCLPQGHAVLVYGTLHPVKLRLRPWWATGLKRPVWRGPPRIWPAK